MADRQVLEGGSNPPSGALLRAQVSAFSIQIPILYLILIVNTLSLAFTFRDTVAWPLALLTPAVFVTTCAVRAVTWLRRKSLTAEQARKALRNTTVMGGVIGGVYLAWTLVLFGYGDSQQQSHVIVSDGLTVVGCIFCLMHVRNAALVLASVVVVPFSIFLILQNTATMIALAIDLASVTAVMAFMLVVHSRSFAGMVCAQIETERLNAENHRLASTDSLTQLPNRRSFFARVDELTTGGLDVGRFIVGLIDLDGFKPVNDLYGHLVGDAVLVEAGQRMMAVAAADTFICRLGGDEFALILTGDVDDETAAAFGERLCDALATPFMALGTSVRLSASIGFVASCQGGGNTTRLYERADYALYHAKQNRRGRSVLFTREHETAIRRSGVIEQSLRNADLASEFSLMFQPIVSVADGRVTTFEALARWTSPELGSIPPSDFIPIAERKGLINRITYALLKQALAEAATWPDEVRVSFNLSAHDLLPEAILRIVSIVERSGMSPSRIVFEITETAAMRDMALAELSLSTLRALGAHIALDDFGAGYSSLSYVRRLPLDKLKIDRDFITDIETDVRSRDVIKSIMDLCRNLKIDCVAEGVETDRQRDILIELGCGAMQGYLFSRPIAAHAVAGYLAGIALDKGVNSDHAVTLAS